MPTKSAVFAAFLAATISTYAQGTIIFNTQVTGQRITLADGTTRLAGDAYFAQLYASATATGILETIGKAYPFRTGDNAGYISIPSVEQRVVVPTVTPGGATYLQIRAWESPYSSYESAVAARAAAGASKIWTQDTAGFPVTPELSPDLLGFEGFSIVIPEPSILALLGIGAAALVVARRR